MFCNNTKRILSTVDSYVTLACCLYWPTSFRVVKSLHKEKSVRIGTGRPLCLLLSRMLLLLRLPLFSLLPQGRSAAITARRGKAQFPSMHRWSRVQIFGRNKSIPKGSRKTKATSWHTNTTFSH